MLILLQGQIPDFFDIWASKGLSMIGPVTGANDLLFEILRQNPGREPQKSKPHTEILKQLRKHNEIRTGPIMLSPLQGQKINNT